MVVFGREYAYGDMGIGWCNPVSITIANSHSLNYEIFRGELCWVNLTRYRRWVKLMCRLMCLRNFCKENSQNLGEVHVDHLPGSSNNLCVNSTFL